MPIATADLREAFRALDAMVPDIHLGTLLFDLVAAHNKLESDHNALVTEHHSLLLEHNALLAHLDTANVAGIGNGNAAAYGVAATVVASTATAPVIGSL